MTSYYNTCLSCIVSEIQWDIEERKQVKQAVFFDCIFFVSIILWRIEMSNTTIRYVK